MMRSAYTVTVSAWARERIIRYLDAHEDYTIGAQQRAIHEMLRALEEAEPEEEQG